MVVAQLEELEAEAVPRSSNGSRLACEAALYVGTLKFRSSQGKTSGFFCYLYHFSDECPAKASA